MIPNWIELQCADRGKRMINFDNVANFYASKGRSPDITPDATILQMFNGDRITVRDSYDYICDTLQKRTRQIRNLISSMAPEQNAG